MNVTIELLNDCPAHWVPAAATLRKWLNVASQALADEAKPCKVSIRTVDEKDSTALNKQYRGKNNPTNVLSFPSDLPAEVTKVLRVIPLGDIALCAPVIEQEAAQQGKTLESHWAHMLTHGFLHLHGYDHKTKAEAKAMESLETDILTCLGYSSPY
ncbi:MAG: rRNA maturation RNase YbeY [Pseudohongiellaceae bacterium]